MTLRWSLSVFAVVVGLALAYGGWVVMHLVQVINVTVVRGEALGDDLDAIVTSLTLVLTPKEHP